MRIYTCRHGIRGACPGCQTERGGIYAMSEEPTMSASFRPTWADDTYIPETLKKINLHLVQLAMDNQITYQTYLEAVKYWEDLYQQEVGK